MSRIFATLDQFVPRAVLRTVTTVDAVAVSLGRHTRRLRDPSEPLRPGANKNPAGIRGEVATAKLLTIEGKPYISLLYITDN
jgi:hypothetical protein